MLKHIIEAAVIFIVVIDPIGTVPLFLTATQGRTTGEQRRIATRAIVVSAVILIFFIALGQILFDYLGIGLHAFRVAGGLVLLLVSLRMILAAEVEGIHLDEKDRSRPPAGDPAVFPIAMPYIAGPGTIMAVVLQTDNDLYAPLEQAVIACVLLAALALTWLTLLCASFFQKWLGKTGIDVVTRVMGVILAALAVQTILMGISGYFKI
ncbi:MAG: MarC family transcriptional regulator [Deltaproteobacteria bacterium HGW-Deltaproteobacteria-19]|nr:MAG: MarC family transcriptional regulator [Deltaproteobacteria bacterium HGW-Deltaproteobacteria-19]